MSEYEYESPEEEIERQPMAFEEEGADRAALNNEAGSRQSTGGGISPMAEETQETTESTTGTVGTSRARSTGTRRRATTGRSRSTGTRRASGTRARSTTSRSTGTRRS